MRKPALKKIGKRILQFGLPIIVLAAFIYAIRKWDWHLLLSNTYHWNPWLLALSLLFFITQELSFGLIWRNILKRLGPRLGILVSLRIYLASEFVRYIPGNVWHVLTRILWVNKYGVSKPVAFASMTIELITKLAAGAIVFALSLLFWGDFGAVGSLLHRSVFIVLGGAFFIVLLILLHPRILNGLLNTALRILKREPITLTLRYSDILLITLAWSGSWLIAGLAFYFLTLAFWPGVPLIALPICMGIYAIAWDFGFVTFITPSGLGFRELAIAVLFGLSIPTIPVGVVAIITLLQRVVSTLAELLCVGAAYFGLKGQLREVQQAETLASSLKDQSNTSQTKEALTAPSKNIAAESGPSND
jgi:uncharacterized membrane protein YbhN (UPF0104 family)